MPLAPPYLPVDEESPLQYPDLYALIKDLLEGMGQMYGRELRSREDFCADPRRSLHAVVDVTGEGPAS